MQNHDAGLNAILQSLSALQTKIDTLAKQRLYLLGLAARFAAILWDRHHTCPQCGNTREKGHMPSCLRTYEGFSGPIDTYSCFSRAFPGAGYANRPKGPENRM